MDGMDGMECERVRMGMDGKGRVRMGMDGWEEMGMVRVRGTMLRM